MIDPTEIVDKATEFADDSFESEQERQATLTERQRIDMTSRYILPQIIRPIITLVLLIMQVAIIVAMFLDIEVPTNIIIEVGALNAVAIGFYFNSRKAEKINAKKVQAAIEIQESKQKIEEIKEKEIIREEKKLNREERRNRRRNK